MEILLLEGNRVWATHVITNWIRSSESSVEAHLNFQLNLFWKRASR